MSGASGTDVQFTIKYSHTSEGEEVIGTLSNSDGNVTCSWTRAAGDSVEVDMTEDDFRELWNQISALKVFKDNLVKKGKPEIDPATHHIVEILFQAGKQSVEQTHLIPADESDDEFADWLGRLRIPATT